MLLDSSFYVILLWSVGFICGVTAILAEFSDDDWATENMILFVLFCAIVALFGPAFIFCAFNKVKYYSFLHERLKVPARKRVGKVIAPILLLIPCLLPLLF